MARATAYLRTLHRAFEQLAKFPMMGREAEAGTRQFQSGRHVVFYRFTDDHIRIIRVLPDRMDVSQHL